MFDESGTTTSTTSFAPSSASNGTLQINSDALNLDLEFGVGKMVYGVPLDMSKDQGHDLELYVQWDSLTPEEQAEYKVLSDEMNLILKSFAAVSRRVQGRLSMRSDAATA